MLSTLARAQGRQAQPIQPLPLGPPVVGCRHRCSLMCREAKWLYGTVVDVEFRREPVRGA